MKDQQLYRDISAEQARLVAIGGDPFGRYLQRCIGLGQAKCAAVQEEYGRFAYLTAIAEAPLTAPPVIEVLWQRRGATFDQDDTSSAHWPGTFGLWKLAKSAEYSRALDLYLGEFGVPPPRRIWPRPEDLIRTVWVNILMWSGFGLGFLGAYLDLMWVAVPSVGVAFLCVSWLSFCAPLGVMRPGD